MKCFVCNYCNEKIIMWNIFFSFSVLKILGDLNSVLPSKIVEDFSIATQRSITVSIVLIYRAVFTSGLVYLDLMSTFMSQ